MKVLLLVATLSALGAQQPASSVVGAYTCRGTQESGAYTLHLTVQAHHGPKNWLLQWTETLGSSVLMSGLGIRQHDQLAVAFVSEAGAVGVASYVVTPGHLNGLWTMGGGKVFPEHCQQGVPL